MARRCSYEKRDLQIACSKVKSKIKSDIDSLCLDTSLVNKTYLYNEVGKKLKLRSGSAFHKPGYKYYEYLNKWYEGIAQMIEEYANSKPQAPSIDSPSIEDVQVVDENLIQELQQKNLIIEHLNSVVRELRMENETLRLRRIHRLHNLDTNKTSDILDENISSNEIKELYELISDIYNATFNKE